MAREYLRCSCQNGCNGLPERSKCGRQDVLNGLPVCFESRLPLQPQAGGTADTELKRLREEGRHSVGLVSLRGGFKNLYGQGLGEAGQCLNFSRGVADGPRFREDPYAKPFNETDTNRTIADMSEIEQHERMVEEENFQRAKHVVPREFLTDKFWQKKLRACCLCGLLKTEAMWLEFGCENCPFLIQPGLETKDRVEAVTTAVWRGMWTILHDNLTNSNLVREKFPKGVAGTASGAPIKGLCAPAVCGVSIRSKHA